MIGTGHHLNKLSKIRINTRVKHYQNCLAKINLHLIIKVYLHERLDTLSMVWPRKKEVGSRHKKRHPKYDHKSNNDTFV